MIIGAIRKSDKKTRVIVSSDSLKLRAIIEDMNIYKNHFPLPMSCLYARTKSSILKRISHNHNPINLRIKDPISYPKDPKEDV